MTTFDPVIFITVRDRVTDLRALVDWLESAGHQRIVLVDNQSTYEPCVDYLANTPHGVVYVDANAGARAVWDCNLLPDDWFVVTDPDIVPTIDCPLDAVAHLRELLDRWKAYDKAGLGLYLEDVPADMPSLDWERRLLHPRRELGDFWAGELAPGVHGSLVDTTFALHRPGTAFLYEALRCGAPYQARHSSWYVREPGPEDRYYLEHVPEDLRGPLGSSWAERAA